MAISWLASLCCGCPRSMPSVTSAAKSLCHLVLMAFRLSTRAQVDGVG